MKIFISWSKPKSLKLAIETKKILENLSSKIQAFVSEVDICCGEEVQNKIIHKIKECDKLVLCFTKDNKKSPWLIFEAGYAKGINKQVIPILFDDDPSWHSWLDNPMNIVRELKFCNENFANLFLEAFNFRDGEKNKKKVADSIERDCIMTPEQAKKYGTKGLIDKIIIKK